MAAQYDQLGNYIGDFETEEERRKREEEQARQTVSTQTITTAADGTQTVTTKQVAQPTVAAPISPETYQRMIQAESGGQNFTPQGQPLTSPKGAMFAAQVMPATAAQPGFGVRPAQAQTPEEYNRVGQEYYQALLKKYNGNEQLAAAAYNMGPGAVDKNIQRNQGQFNVAQAPRETQGYLNKVFQGAGQAITNMFPSAQAGTLPQPQAGAGRGTMGMPQVFPEEGVAVATGRGVQGTMDTPAQRQMAIVTGQAQQQTQPATSAIQPYIEMYQRDQDDPLQMLALRGDTSAPEFIRKRAGDRARELMEQEYKKSEAERQAKELVLAAGQGDRKASNTIAKELQSQEGSWIKMLLLGFISPQLAGEEAVKLGFGNKWTQGYDAQGNAALIQVNAKGLPLKGYDSKGNELAAESLPAFMTGGKRNLDIVGGTYVNDTTGEVGRVVTDKNTGRSYIQTDTGMKPMSGFRPQSSQGTLADMRTRAIQDLNIKLQGKGVEEQMQILRPYNQMLVQNGFQPVQPAEVGIRVPQVGGGAAAPVAPAAPQAGVAAPAAPAAPVAPQTAPAAAPATAPQVLQQPAPAAPATAGAGMGGRPTAAQMEAVKTGATTAAKEISGAAATEYAKSADTVNLVNSINKSIKILDSGEHNLGSMSSVIVGRGPIAQAIGSQLETPQARNTKQVMDLVNKLAADGLKALGSNPSTVDLEFWTKFKPDASSDPQFVRDWIQSRSKDLENRLNTARQQLNMPPVSLTGEQKTTDGTMTPAERAKAELERRRKEKK